MLLNIKIDYIKYYLIKQNLKLKRKLKLTIEKNKDWIQMIIKSRVQDFTLNTYMLLIIYLNFHYTLFGNLIP